MTREEAIRCLGVHSSTNGSGLCTDEQHYEAKQMAIKALEQIESLNKVRLGTKQYVRLDDVLKIIKEQEDGNSKADKKESRRI